MFPASPWRASPWNHYKPANQDHDPEQNPTNEHPTSDMDEDVDMDAPQISILQDDKTPPPAAKTTKFRVKLLVNDKKRDHSQASREDEPEEDQEEDELIDDDDEDAAQVSRSEVTPKRVRKSRASAAGASRRKSAKTAAPGAGPSMTWVEISGPDTEAGKQGQPGDAWESASVASNTPASASVSVKKKPAPKGGAKPKQSATNQLKLSTTLSRDDADTISEAAYTGTAPSSPAREMTPDLESIEPTAMSIPSVSVMTAEESLEGVAQPVYPLPTKPFPVLPPPKMPSGFAPTMSLDKSGKKVRHWRQTKREIRGIAGGRWFARSWAGAKDSEYAIAVAAGLANLPHAEPEKASGSVKASSASVSTKGGAKTKQPKTTDTAPSSRSSSIVPDVPPTRTSGPSKMRESHVAEPDVEVPVET